jgi:hypothetical protein
MDRCMSIYLGNHKLKEIKREPHLGVVLATEDKHEVEYIQERIVKCKAISYGVQSLGTVGPLVAQKLHKEIIIPKLCYGVEVLEVSEHAMEHLIMFQNQCAKVMQAVPRQTSNVGSVATAGLMSINATVDLMRMMFVWRVLLLPMSNMYKVMMLRSLVELVAQNYGKGPVWNIINVCKKYGVLEEVMSAVDLGDYENISSWKRKVKGLVLEKDFRNLKITCKIYRSLNLLQVSGSEHNVLSWWVYAHRYPKTTMYVRLVVKILLNTYRLGKEGCKVCGTGQLNSATHILFECNGIQNVRDQYWHDVEQTGPLQIRHEMRRMSNYDRTKFVLNAFFCQFIADWTDLYHSTCRYCYKMYIAYKEKE